MNMLRWVFVLLLLVTFMSPEESGLITLLCLLCYHCWERLSSNDIAAVND